MHALLSNSALLQSLLAASGDCIKILALDGSLLFMSEGGRRMMDVADFEAIRGCQWPDLWAAHSGAAAVAALESARGGGVGRFSAATDTLAGTQKWWDVEVRPILDSDGRPEMLLAVSRDVTEQRQSELRLRALAASLTDQVAERTADRNRLWELSTDLMLVVRFDGTILALNPAWTQTLGWTEAEMLGRRLFDFVHPDDVACTLRGRAELEAGRARSGTINRYRHKDGGYRWICWNAVPGGGVINAVGRDFTTERQQTEALERSELRLRSIFESSYQFQGLLEPDGTLLHANPTSLAAIEAGPDDVVGRKFWDTLWFVKTPGIPEQVAAAVKAVAAGQSVRRELTLNLPGGPGIFDFSMRPVFDANGNVTAIVPEAIDLTQWREAEARLRQAQKMEAVGQLTSGLAHDFNNLLTGIMGSLELLQLHLSRGRTDGLDHYINTALGAAGRAAALTHRLLAFSRRQTLDPKPIEANRLIQETEELIRRTAGPAIAIETTLAPMLWLTFCDPNQLENAVLNLCINARDAMPDGGRLTIRTSNASVTERMARYRGMLRGDYVAISVADTGTGMTPDVLSRAFDPFFTTKPLGRGTGLGLSMIYGFARQSGGHVQIESEVGFGTCVTLYVPRHDGTDDTKPAPAGSPAVARAAEGQTVLVVDDEPTVRVLVIEALRDLGYATIEAEDGSSALAVLLSASRIDLLVSDVGLPGGMNGRQLADAAQQMRPDLKVLFITGYAENALVANAPLETAIHVLIKPFTMETLGARVKQIIDQ